MPLPSIFDFDSERLADFQQDKMEDALRRYPAEFVSHLQTAESIQKWAERMEEHDIGLDDGRYREGYAQALRGLQLTCARAISSLRALSRSTRSRCGGAIGALPPSWHRRIRPTDRSPRTLGGP